VILAPNPEQVRPLAPRPFAVLAILGLVLGAVACTILPASLPFASGAEPTAIPLARCSADPTLVCVVTFGISPPDEMLVAILLPFGGFTNIRMTLEYDGQQVPYSCSSLPGFPERFSCTGPQVPLGSAVRLTIRTGAANTLLARGEFVVAGLALPTVARGGTPLPLESASPLSPTAALSLTPLPFQTPGTTFPGVGTGTSTLPVQTVLPLRPGYPNP
jgi:hypothetical protein